MTPWLHVVGIGEDGLAGMSPAARALVEAAEVLVGGERHLAMIPPGPAERLPWPRQPVPLDERFADIAARRGRRVVVLATGNPMFFGIGVRLVARFPVEEMVVLPAPSAFSLACARLGWPQGRVETLSVHGRPTELINRFLSPGRRLVILSRDGRSPAEIAELATARGFGPSRLTVLEHMGGADERRVTGTADGWRHDAVADLNLVALECVPGPDAIVWSQAPGLPDAAYRHDGLVTKQEVRSVTLAALAPLPGQLLWDVGAGCGSVAIEWLRSGPDMRAVAVERDPGRVALVAENAAALGVPELRPVTGTAPEALVGLAPPDAVFVGGGASRDDLVETCWRALAPGGRLVANAVTLEGERALLAWHERLGGTLRRIAVSRAGPVGAFTGWRALTPVTQFAVEKPRGPAP